MIATKKRTADLAELRDLLLDQELLALRDEVINAEGRQKTLADELHLAANRERYYRGMASGQNPADLKAYLESRQRAVDSAAETERLRGELEANIARIAELYEAFEAKTAAHFEQAAPQLLRAWRTNSAAILDALDALAPLLEQSEQLRSLAERAVDGYGRNRWQMTGPANPWRRVGLQRILPRAHDLFRVSGTNGLSAIDDARAEWRAKGWL